MAPEHPYTAISDQSNVHTNHNEANSALRRRFGEYSEFLQNQLSRLSQSFLERDVFPIKPNT